MKKTWFDNFRWEGLAARISVVLSSIEAILHYVPAQYRPWAIVVVAVLSTAESFIRNPKNLGWMRKAADAGEAIQEALEYPED